MSGGAGESIDVPPLSDVLLDDAQLAQLALDLEHAAELIDVAIRPLGARRAAASGRPSLAAAVRALTERTASVQLRYRYRGEEWWDTLLPAGVGVRLVRISHTRALACGGDTSSPDGRPRRGEHAPH
jgi:hypothetical protein